MCIHTNTQCAIKVYYYLYSISFSHREILHSIDTLFFICWFITSSISFRNISRENSGHTTIRENIYVKLRVLLSSGRLTAKSLRGRSVISIKKKI